MPKYIVDGKVVSSTDHDWASTLRLAHSSQQRLLCLCRPESKRVPLYIACYSAGFVAKRMPFTGDLHAPHCEHYEPPPELSGFGQVSGSAIKEDIVSETTALRLDFPLSKGPARAAPVSAGTEHASVRSDGTKLTLRAFFHFLLDEAGLTRWSPKMLHKRTWFVVRRELLHAAEAKTTKGENLGEILYIPETFDSSHASDIAARQAHALQRFTKQKNARMILVAMVKAIEQSRFGYKLIARHLPNTNFYITDELHRQLQRRFADELLLWNKYQKTQLAVISTFSKSTTGVYLIEDICLVNLNEHWLPFEHVYEHDLIEALVNEQRYFVKGLRYNLPLTKPLASAILQDTGSEPTALFIELANSMPQQSEEAEQFISSSKLPMWRWNAENQAMPAFPHKQHQNSV